jgi:hypothetical protein
MRQVENLFKKPINDKKRKQANRIGHTMHWNCLQKHFKEGKIDGRK